MKDVLLSIDVGTASLRAALVSLDGRILASNREAIRLWNGVGRMEQSSDNIWQTLTRSVRNLMNNHGCPPEAVLAIGIDATSSQVFLDNNLDPLPLPGNKQANILGWMDHRALKQAEQITMLLGQYTPGFSSRLIPEMSLPKLLWLQQEHPAIWDQCGRVLDLYDYLTWKATGWMTRTDYSMVTRDNPELLNELGLHPGQRFAGEHLSLGAAVPDGLCKRAAMELGLLPGTPVATGIVDGYGGALSVTLAANGNSINDVAVSHKRLSMIVGTSTIYIASSETPKEVANAWGPMPSVLPGTWHNVVGQTAAGALLDYVINTHPAYSDALEAACSSGISIYQYFHHRLQHLAGTDQSVSTLTRDIHMLPYHAGNRCPRMDMSLTGMVSGLRLDNSEDHLSLIYLATIQAIALGARHNLDTLIEAGYDFDLLMPAGGLAKNPLFIQEHLNAMGLPAAMPEEADAMLLSGAITGSVATGVYPSFVEAMQGMNRYREVRNPDPQQAAFYDKKYQVFLEMYEDQMKYREIMKQE